MTKRKQQRRELLKEDEFLNFVEKAVKYCQENVKKVLFATIGIVAALIVIFAATRLWERGQEQKASTLYQAEKIMDTDLQDPNSTLKFGSEDEKFEAALKALDEVIESQSGTTRDQAIVRKIACLTNLGRQGEVEVLYQELAKSSGQFSGLGKLGLGDYYAAQNDFDAALEHYNGVLSKDSGLLYEDLVHLKMAQCYKEKGDFSTARVELDALIAKFEEQPQEQRSPLYQKAKDLHEELEKQTPAEEPSEAS